MPDRNSGASDAQDVTGGPAPQAQPGPAPRPPASQLPPPVFQGQFGTPGNAPPGPTFSLNSKSSNAFLGPASDLREPLLRRLFNHLRRLGRRR